ncbi:MULTISPECIES: hypothetical protein [unclassified Burkholderia]|uniref:hypothetical protein n=1 Tax=unclassified Burkholderia TaxID=2613784 RepID=UPI0014239B0C|nr:MULTISPECIES: hypothetical protein [unclassified Burkholderia]
MPKHVYRPAVGATRQPAPRDEFNIVGYACRHTGVPRCAERELERFFPQRAHGRPVDRCAWIAIDFVERRHPLRIKRLGIATVQRAVAIQVAEELEKPGTDRIASMSSRCAFVIASPSRCAAPTAR